MRRRIDFKVTANRIRKRRYLLNNKWVQIILLVSFIVLFVLLSYQIIVSLFGNSTSLPNYVSTTLNDTITTYHDNVSNEKINASVMNNFPKATHLLFLNSFNKETELDGVLFFDYYPEQHKSILYYFPSNFVINHTELSYAFSKSGVSGVSKLFYDAFQFPFHAIHLNNKTYNILLNMIKGIPIYIKDSKSFKKVTGKKKSNYANIKDYQNLLTYLNSDSYTEKQHRTLYIWINIIKKFKTLITLLISQLDDNSIDFDNQFHNIKIQDQLTSLIKIPEIDYKDIRIYYPVLNERVINKKSVYLPDSSINIDYDRKLYGLLLDYNEISIPVRVTLENLSGYNIDNKKIENYFNQHNLEIVLFLDHDESVNDDTTKLIMNCYDWNKSLYCMWLFEIKELFDKYQMKYRYSDIILQIGNDFKIKEIQ